MSSTIRYSLVRLLIFLACLGVFRLLGLENPLWLLLAAATVSMLISVFALDGMRNRMSEEIVARAERRRLARAGEGSPVDPEVAARMGDATAPATTGGRRGARSTPRTPDEDVEDQAFR